MKKVEGMRKEKGAFFRSNKENCLIDGNQIEI